TGEPVLLPAAPTGYFTAYQAGTPNLETPLELWPRLLHRPQHTANLELFPHVPNEGGKHVTLRNVRKLLEAWHLRGEKPLPRTLARALLTLPKQQTLEGWLRSLPDKSSVAERGRSLADELRALLEPEETPPPEPFTYER